MRAVLAMPGWAGEASSAHLHALEAAGGLAYWAGDMADASVHYADAEREARLLDDRGELANALYNRFFAHRASSTADDWVSGITESSQPFLTEALAIWTDLGDDAGRAKALWALSEHHTYRREPAAAEAAATEALALFATLGDSFWIAWAHFMRGFARILGENVAGAAADVAAAMRDFRDARDASGVALVLAALSSFLLDAGRPHAAYELAGAAQRATAETGVHLAALWPVDMFRSADEMTPDPELRAAWATGAAWSREAAVEHALVVADELAGAVPGDA